jgi:DNA-binding transcriptional MerR regulator
MERTETLLPIGRFARLSGLTIKALRHYDAIGLLEPARVDDGTGYRFYSLAQLADAAAIARLRELELPLDECAAILTAHDPAVVRDRLESHRERLGEKAADIQRSVDALETLIAAPGALWARTPLEKVEVKEVEPQPVLAMRSQATSEELDARISEGINGVAAYLRELGTRGAGPPFTVLSDPDDEGTFSVAIGWPTAEKLPGRGRIESFELGSGSIAWAVYRGPYAGLPGAYRALYEWIVEHGREVAGDPREIYYTDPDEVVDPADYLTGIVWPLA